MEFIQWNLIFVVLFTLPIKRNQLELTVAFKLLNVQYLTFFRCHNMFFSFNFILFFQVMHLFLFFLWILFFLLISPFILATYVKRLLISWTSYLRATGRRVFSFWGLGPQTSTGAPPLDSAGDFRPPRPLNFASPNLWLLATPLVDYRPSFLYWLKCKYWGLRNCMYIVCRLLARLGLAIVQAPLRQTQPPSKNKKIPEVT